MTSPRVVRRLAWGTALLSVALGGVLWVLPPSVHVAPAPPLVLAGMARQPAPAADPAIAEDIVLSNVFARSRSAPTSRFTPPELAGDSANGATGEVPMMPPEGSPVMAAAGEVPRLFGTVVGPAGTRALLQLDPSIPDPRLYDVGDGDGGYRVIAIAPRTVVLRGPGGRVTLRLDDEGRKEP